MIELTLTLKLNKFFIGKSYTTENTMASNRNMNKIIRACYDLNQDWNKELNEMECELNHCREVAEEYINIKDQETVELKRKLEEEKRKLEESERNLEESERKRQEVEKEMENFKKHRKELLNLVMDIRRRHSGYSWSPKNLLVDHMDKLMICATNLYESIPDIYEDRKFKNRYERSITDLCWKIKRAQYDINCRPNKQGTVTNSTVTPTRHSCVLIPRRDIIWDIRRKRGKVLRKLLFGEDIRRKRGKVLFGEDSDSDSDSDSY